MLSHAPLRLQAKCKGRSPFPLSRSLSEQPQASACLGGGFPHVEGDPRVHKLSMCQLDEPLSHVSCPTIHPLNNLEEMP